MDASMRRMFLASCVTLVGSAVLFAAALRVEGHGVPVIPLGLFFWLVAGHAVVIDFDRRRRGEEGGGCLTALVALGLPPFGVSLYLIATYKAKAVVLLPLYLGLLSLTAVAGWGLAWLLGRI